MIRWGTIQDRHLEGISSLGKVFVRTNKEGKVTAMYTLFDNIIKYVPSEEWMEDTIGAQLELERLENLEQFSRNLADKNKI